MRKYTEGRSVYGVLKTGVKAIIVFEVALFAGSYILWKSLNNSQDLRYKLYKKSPMILEGYYKIGDMYNSDMRKLDKEAWQIK